MGFDTCQIKNRALDKNINTVMNTGTLNFWNSRKHYGVVSEGKNNVYVKRHHIVNPPAPAELLKGMEVEFNREINGMEINSTCDLIPKTKSE